MLDALVRREELKHFQMYCGLGAMGLGFNRGHARVGRVEGQWRCLGGVDVDPAGIRDFTNLVGVKGTVLDLFNRDQYRAWHGKEPPPTWKEATAEDLWLAAGGEHPDAICTSPPCKGLSGLLNPAAAASPKYQALNELTLRGIALALEAFAADPASFFILENVPRIQQRGRPLLDDIVTVLKCHGYVVAESVHDCGVIGNLGQTRKRFLLVARHRAKVPPFLYEPPSLGLRTVGDVIGDLPMPGAAGVAMHRCPNLEWQTWMRLALIPAGKDWRALKDLKVVDGNLAELGVMPLDTTSWYPDVLGVREWDATSGTVAGRSSPSNGVYSVADPRPQEGRFNNVCRVVRIDETSPTVTGGAGPTAGGLAVADPRPVEHRRNQAFGVRDWDQPTGVVAGESHPSNGAYAVADPRCSTRWGGSGKYLVTPMDETAGTVIAESTTGNGAFAIADPRPAAWVDGRASFTTGGHYGVVRLDAPSGTVVGKAKHDTGPWSVADRRLPDPKDRPDEAPLIISLDDCWHRPFTTLEMAALQGFPWQALAFGGGLDGKSDAKHRERIGNAVPPPAATAMASVIGRAILAARAGVTFELSMEPVWVQPLATALSLPVGMGDT